MNITKFGHSCLLIEQGEARILIDPGAWSEGHTSLTNLAAILITHEHQDHCDPASLKALREKNPDVVILANSDVQKKLSEAGISSQIFEEGNQKEIRGLRIQAVGHDHAVIYGKTPCQNTGFIIGEKLFHPGDAFHMPSQPVQILALPVCAPWLKMNEVIDFATSVRPQVAFPIHDGMLKHIGPFHKFPQTVLEGKGIQWHILEPGVVVDF